MTTQPLSIAPRRRRFQRLAAFLFENPQLRRPVSQRQAQAGDVRVPAPERLLRVRNLPAASVDSSRDLGSLLGDLAEGSPVAIEDCILSRELLPADNGDVHVLRLKLNQSRLAPGFLTSDQR